MMAVAGCNGDRLPIEETVRPQTAEQKQSPNVLRSSNSSHRSGRESQLQDPGPAVPQRELVRLESEHPAMGILFRAVVHCRDPERMKAALDRGWARVDELNRILSDYLADSEIARLAKSAPHNEPQTVSPDLFLLLERAAHFSERTSGAFDVTVGPVSHLWRASIRRNRLPEKSKVEAAVSLVGWSRVELSSPDRIRLPVAGMEFDFGGIAQGYAADCVLAMLLEAGAESGLVDASGDIVVQGNPPDLPLGWRVAVPNPVGHEKLTLQIRQGSVSTSGDLEQALVVEGVRYSHVVDPRTGAAVENSALVTVIAPDGTTADALASAFCVLSVEEGQKLAASLPGVEVRWVRKNPENQEKPEETTTPGFRSFVVTESESNGKH